jgi:hypothetical protein
MSIRIHQQAAGPSDVRTVADRAAAHLARVGVNSESGLRAAVGVRLSTLISHRRSALPAPGHAAGGVQANARCWRLAQHPPGAAGKSREEHDPGEARINPTLTVASPPRLLRQTDMIENAATLMERLEGRFGETLRPAELEPPARQAVVVIRRLAQHA